MYKQQLGCIAAALMLVWLSGCTSTTGTAVTQLSLEDAVNRETTLTGSYPVSPEDQFFAATVPGSAAPAVRPDEGLYHVTIPLNTRIPAECFLYRDALDSATTLRNLVNALLEDFSRTGIMAIDAGNFEHLPYLYQESLYLTDQGAAGILKAIVVPVGSTTLACLHDEPGYRETFTGMVAGLAGSMRIAGEQAERWKFQEILVWQLRDLNVGYSIYRAGKPVDGEIKSVVETALLIPRTSQETMAHDGYDLTYETESGELVDGRYAEAENGDITLSITLERNAPNIYRVSGQFQGKEIESRLDTAQHLAGPWHNYVELVRAAHPADGRPRALTTRSYIPSANPLQTIAIEARPTGQRIDDLPEYSMLFSGLEATSVVDTTGQKAVTVQMGPLEMRLTRTYMNGRI